MNDILGIVGSVSNPSNTRSAVEVALQSAKNQYNVNAEILHLAEYNLETADGRNLEAYTGDTVEALELILNSKAYIIGTPVYRGSYPGALKNLFDMIPRGKWQADVAPLEAKAVGLVATGATAHHYLSISQELGPILDFFGSHTVGGGVYAHSSHFDNYQVTDPDIKKRLELLGRATVELSRAIETSDALANFGPQF